jgi:hypothetical protein
MKTAFQLIEEHGLTLHGDIEHFAELVRVDEREACAKVCETFDQREMFNDEDMAVANACATAIRARSNT